MAICIVVIKLRLFVVSLLLLHPFVVADVSSLRERTREGLRKVRSYVPQSIIEAALSDMQSGQLPSALRKLKYHQRLNPRDPEGYFLEGELFAKIEKYRDAYIAYHKAYFLTGSSEIRQKMEDMKVKGGVVESQDDDEGRSNQSNSSEEPSGKKGSDEKVSDEKVEEESFEPAAGNFLILGKLRALDSLIKRYEARNGSPPVDLNLASLQAGDVTTAKLDLSDLGDLKIKDGKVFSSVFGTVADQEASLKLYKQAIAQDASGATSESIRILEVKGEERLTKQELNFLIRMTQKMGDTEKSLIWRQVMAKRFPNNHSNLFILANYHFRKGQHAEALEFFELIAAGNSSLKKESEAKIGLIRRGGSYRLQEVFQELKKDLSSSQNSTP